MRLVFLFAAGILASAQLPDPAFQPLDRAYTALRARDYDTAIPAFLQAIQVAPRRADIRKDLAYAYLRIGETALARDQFGEAMQLAPADTQSALEYAFLCNETKREGEARRIFDRIRKTGDAIAEMAFQNIDVPLAQGIARWQKAIDLGADNFSVHFELATLAEKRDELPLAAAHYEKAWRILPDRRSVLVDLGRVWKAQDRTGEATAALLAASRGGEPRAAEMARELLPARYPFVPEFRAALALDPTNNELRRELGYLLLRMYNAAEAEDEFRILTQNAPADLLSTTQLGFLLYARGDQLNAMPLFERVMAGPDEDLANRIRAVLRIPQVLKSQPAAQAASIDAKVMAERSMKAGYMKDALKYLQIAHEADPGDFSVMFKLGSTYNILHQDLLAFRWFDLARKSSDPQIASEAVRGWRNLRGIAQRWRSSVWLFPIFSTRWHDLFTYAQAKTEFNIGLPVRPYISTRFTGDTRGTIGAVSPQYLSESSFIFALGLGTDSWHGLHGWAEAGTSVSYVKGHMVPDYRGGISFARTLRGESTKWFADTAIDALYISRFDHDVLAYAQSRLGYKLRSGAALLERQRDGGRQTAGLGQFRRNRSWNPISAAPIHLSDLQRPARPLPA